MLLLPVARYEIREEVLADQCDEGVRGDTDGEGGEAHPKFHDAFIVDSLREFNGVL